MKNTFLAYCFKKDLQMQEKQQDALFMLVKFQVSHIEMEKESNNKSAKNENLY